MYKIVEVANYHQFDGIELSEKDFVKLLDVLQMGKFFYEVKVLKDGEKQRYSNLP